MKFRLFIVLSLLIITGTSAYSSGALRFVLPYLSSFGSLQMKEGEIAYDDTNKRIVYKTNDQTLSLIPNLDQSNYGNFPLIETAISFWGQPYVYSYISAGKIKIGNKEFINSQAISCDSRNAGWNGHDDTTPTGYVDDGNIPPTYLYLSENGNGFRCIYSFSSTGPSSNYSSSRWLRAATNVGSYGSATMLKTIGGFTYGRSINMRFIPGSGGGPFTVDQKNLITSTMKLIKFGRVSCSSSNYFLLMEPHHVLNENSASVVAQVPVIICSSSPYITDTTDLILGSTSPSVLTFNGNYVVNVPIAGWLEKPLASL